MRDPDLLPLSTVAAVSTLPAQSGTTACPPLFLSDEDRQALIVIPTVGTPSVLLPAFAKLLQCLDGIPVHVCVSLNPKDPADGQESYEGVVDLWQRAAKRFALPPRSVLTIYRHPAPCGFGGALNRGIMAAAGDLNQHAQLIEDNTGATIAQWGLEDQSAVTGLPELTVFYNDDLEAAPGWLAELLSAARSETVCDMTEPAEPGSERRKLRPMAAYGKVGLVGPCTNNAAGYQRIGAEEIKAWRRAGTVAYAAEWRARNSGYVLTADFLSGFCMGITRDCLLALWGADVDRDGPALFDEGAYPIAGYEDNDLCVRTLLAGYKAIIAAGSFVGHIGHQTFDAMFPEARRGMRNRLSYYEKWSDWVCMTSTAEAPVVAALRVKIEVPNDLLLLRATLGRLGELADGAAVLLTGAPEDALRHEEGRAALAQGEFPPPDLELLRALEAIPVENRADRSRHVLKWLKECMGAGARNVGAPMPSVTVAWWTAPFNERDERNFLLGMAETMRVRGVPASWVWSMDHDEVVEPRITRALLNRWTRHPDPLVSQYAQSFYTPWTSDHTLYRVDRPWGDDGLMRGAMRGWRLYRINRAAPGRIIAGTDNGLHCGNIPTSDAMSKRMSAIRILHLGYTRREDRVRKYERYKRQDPNPDRALVGGSSYEHLINEDVVTLSQFNDRNGIGLHMLCHEGEDLNGVMQHLDSLHGVLDAGVLVWTSPSTDTDACRAVQRIAALFGVDLVHHPIDVAKGDMAAARNAGIDRLQTLHDQQDPCAHGIGWSLFFDPDEIPPQDAPPMLLRMADAVDCWTWLFPFVNTYEGGGANQSESIRMARLLPEVRMDGAVHEGFGQVVSRLRREGWGVVMRSAPFQTYNVGLAISPEKLQAKNDRYFRWALSAIAGGSNRMLDWVTVGMYFANEGLMEAPAVCYAHAMKMDGESFLPAQELAMHYQRMSRIALQETVRRLDGHPRAKGYLRLLEVSEKTAPDVAGTGTVGQPGHVAWSEEQAMALIQTLMDAERAHAAPVQQGAQEPVHGDDVAAQEGAEGVHHPGPVVEQEDDGDAG